MQSAFTQRDLEDLATCDRSVSEVEEQLRIFASPPKSLRLLRPAHPSDGVTLLGLGEQQTALSSWKEAANSGRFSKFVPASGAASRMFQSLAAFLSSPASASREDALRLVANLDLFAFAPKLIAVLESAGLSSIVCEDVVRTMLSDDGLQFSRLPKGLIPFHRYSSGGRTPFEEHLVEAAQTIASADGVCRVHFTVTEDFEDAFKAVLEAARPALEARFGVRYAVTFSIQHASTDTIAVDLANEPFRLENGSIFFRPGGHGALLKNLADTGGDLVYLKNIDNVVPESRQEKVILWKRLIGGHLVFLEKQISLLQESLSTGEDPEIVEHALTFLRETFGSLAPENLAFHEKKSWALSRMNRPARVCGVVKNAGEPGGGPFWTVNASGRVSLQIIESSQVDMSDPEQKAIWNSSSHFNPVDLVCSLRDTSGNSFDLEKFVDHDAVFISKKSKDGRDLKALERPGLWNGAMSDWNTVFVDVPLETFAPVKTVFDLLRPEHQN